MTIKTPIFAAALLGLSAIALPGMPGSAHAAGHRGPGSYPPATCSSLPPPSASASAQEAAFASALDAAHGLASGSARRGSSNSAGAGAPFETSRLLHGCLPAVKFLRQAPRRRVVPLTGCQPSRGDIQSCSRSRGAASRPASPSRPPAGSYRGAQAQRAKLLRFGLSAWPPNLQPWVSTGASAGTGRC